MTRRRSESRLCRRAFVHSVAAGTAAGCTGSQLIAAEAEQQAKPAGYGKAQSCIFIWLGGGACHVDTWDPKRKGDGRKQAGSYYDPVDTAIAGVQVCEHLQQTAALLDRAVLVRSVQHDIQDHQPATNLMHTGRPTTGTTQYPALGAVVAHERGPRSDAAPPYVVIGYPNPTRSPGFLGAESGYLYLTDVSAGPQGLRRPPEITPARQARREALLGKLRERYSSRHAQDRRIADYAAASEAGFRLGGPEFMKTFDLAEESDALRESYGGEFGQRCLLARRLIERGVRFIEVSFNLNFINGTGWDTHNEGQLRQHLLIRDLDRGLATLLADLERRRLLDTTLVVVATEFGRPPEFDGGGGRGHHPRAFSVFLGGGGLQTGQVVGQTDELGREVVADPVPVSDLHATIYAALGVNPAKELHDGDRPVPITDHGRAIGKLIG